MVKMWKKSLWAEIKIDSFRRTFPALSCSSSTVRSLTLRPEAHWDFLDELHAPKINRGNKREGEVCCWRCSFVSDSKLRDELYKCDTVFLSFYQFTCMLHKFKLAFAQNTWVIEGKVTLPYQKANKVAGKHESVYMTHPGCGLKFLCVPHVCRGIGFAAQRGVLSPNDRLTQTERWVWPSTV